jgi:hypothetical protein
MQLFLGAADFLFYHFTNLPLTIEKHCTKLHAWNKCPRVHLDRGKWLNSEKHLATLLSHSSSRTHWSYIYPRQMFWPLNEPTAPSLQACIFSSDQLISSVFTSQICHWQLKNTSKFGKDLDFLFFCEVQVACMSFVLVSKLYSPISAWVFFPA